jgi:hypothetical protein
MGNDDTLKTKRADIEDEPLTYLLLVQRKEDDSGRDAGKADRALESKFSQPFVRAQLDDKEELDNEEDTGDEDRQISCFDKGLAYSKSKVDDTVEHLKPVVVDD